jgi:hypothetical protein
MKTPMQELIDKVNLYDDKYKEYVNRYGDKYTFSFNDQGNVDWRGPFLNCRCMCDENKNIVVVDPSGGPFISIYYPLEVAGIDRKAVGFKHHTTYWEILLEPAS